MLITNETSWNRRAVIGAREVQEWLLQPRSPPSAELIIGAVRLVGYDDEGDGISANAM